MNDAFAAGFQHPPNLIKTLEQFILGKMLDDIKSDNYILRLFRQSRQNVEDISFNDPGYAPPLGFGYLRHGTIDTRHISVTCLLGKIEDGSVATAHVQDRGVLIRRKVISDQILDVWGPELQPVQPLRGQPGGLGR
jgi:hypothetical protein